MSSFSHYARKAVNPGLPLDKRRYALDTCIRKFVIETYRGSITDGDYALYRRSIRKHLIRRFGFDDVPLDPQRLVTATNFLQAEINRLREVSRVLYRRRVSQKVRGIRTASRADRKAAYDIWERAVMQSRKSLQQQL